MIPKNKLSERSVIENIEVVQEGLWIRTHFVRIAVIFPDFGQREVCVFQRVDRIESALNLCDLRGIMISAFRNGPTDDSIILTYRQIAEGYLPGIAVRRRFQFDRYSSGIGRSCSRGSRVIRVPGPLQVVTQFILNIVCQQFERCHKVFRARTQTIAIVQVVPNLGDRNLRSFEYMGIGELEAC